MKGRGTDVMTNYTPSCFFIQTADPCYPLLPLRHIGTNVFIEFLYYNGAWGSVAVKALRY
jgi:hypothetical protein